MSIPVKLSDQQYNTISILWEKGEASAKEVQAALTKQSLAHNTVATILTRLEKKGILSSHTRGRERVYAPLLKENEVRTSMVSGLISTLFSGDKTALFTHLLQEGDIDEAELDSLRALLKKGEGDE